MIWLFKCKKVTVDIIPPGSLLQDSEYLNLPTPPNQALFGPVAGADLTPSPLAYVVVEVQDGTLNFSALDPPSFSSQFSQHIWVRAVK